MQRVQRGVGRESAVFAAVLVLIVAGSAFLWFPRDPSTTVVSTTTGTATPGTLSSFQTYQELHQFIVANAKSAQQNGYGFGGPGIIMAGGVAQLAIPYANTNAVQSAASATPDYTTTNNQVAGVDELDTVKTDGSYLYVASSQSVTIIKAQPAGSTSVVSTIKLPEANILGIAHGAAEACRDLPGER